MPAGWIAADVAIVLVPVITLGLGILIGFLAQRSGFCSIGGFRDLFLFKQTRLFFGYMALIAFALLGYFIFWLIAPVAMTGFYWAGTQANPLTPIPGSIPGLNITAYVILALIGGIGMGFLGVLLGGCPLRQVVMWSEGNRKSMFFFVGMVIGAIIYHAFILSLVQGWFVAAGLGA